MRPGCLGAPLLGKTIEPVVHVGCVADLAGLAVADDVDADLDLAFHDIQNGLLHLAIELRGVEGLAIFPRLEKSDHDISARQTADMRGEDAILARLHEAPALRRTTTGFVNDRAHGETPRASESKAAHSPLRTVHPTRCGCPDPAASPSLPPR